MSAKVAGVGVDVFAEEGAGFADPTGGVETDGKEGAIAQGG